MEREQPDLISARVAAIIASAEQAAAGVREHAEARARERIAEGDRAAENRVGAAEAEAEEILRSARAQAEAARNDAVSAVAARGAMAFVSDASDVCNSLHQVPQFLHLPGSFGTGERRVRPERSLGC